MSDCRFGVSPVNYPDPDPDEGHPINSGTCLLWDEPYAVTWNWYHYLLYQHLTSLWDRFHHINWKT